jgi:predicted dehydrogenase
MDERHRLLFLDPGHFHATLTLRTMHPRVADEIVVYAPDTPERRDFLALVDRFNQRATNATRWRVDVVTTDDPLARLMAEKRGDVVILAGKNGGKARTFRRLHDAGFHVLADKPWLVDAADLDDVQVSLAGWPIVTEIMTGRHDVAARVLKRLVDAPAVFGGFRAEAPGLEMSSIHYLEKTVDGAPLRRPWWFFDVRVQGRGVVDIPTHLVDRGQWLAGGEPQLVSARTWSTRVPEDAFRRITAASGFPPSLQPSVESGALLYECNAELVYRTGDVVTQASARWDLTPPPGGSDNSVLVAHGTRADLRLEQSARTGYRRQLVAEGADVGAVEAVIRASQADLPGLRGEPRSGNAIEIVIPAALDGGHEAHFVLVLDEFLRTIDSGRWPADVAARTLAKYAVLAEAAKLTA